jgi:CheY-like chemotaxis protein
VESPVASSPRIYSILVVEDNAVDAELIHQAFKECGSACKLTMTDTLDKAEEALRSIPIDLVLSDMQVNNDDSEEFIRRIRNDSRLKSLPIIILSGALNPRPAYEAGANAFVSKSIDVDQFFGKIQALMHFWVNVAELPRLRL